MCRGEFLILCYALCTSPYDSLSIPTNPGDTVEYQVYANYSGYPAGWLTLLKTEQGYWFPLNQWLEQSGFAYFHSLHKQPFHRLRLRNPADDRNGIFQIGGYSPLQSKPWRIYPKSPDPSIKGNRLVEHFWDHHQTLWVSNRWIALQYGMATQFNEQALELEFTGMIKAPVKEWSDFNHRWLKLKAIKSPNQSGDTLRIHSPKAETKSFEISTLTGRYEIHSQSGRFDADVQWDAVGHAGKVGLRAFGSSKIAWPGLEFDWAWGTQHHTNLFISPYSGSGLWKISGGNTLLNRTIGFELPGGLHERRWNPPAAMSEWSLNHGPFNNQLHPPKTISPIVKTDPLLEIRNLVPLALLPGSNLIEYRYRNAWGGISSRKLLWNIPGMMIPHGRWNYRYEISAPLRVSGIVGYGLRPSFCLQTEAAMQTAKDNSKNLEWEARASAIWTAGRTVHGQSQYAISHKQAKWEQHLHFNFSQSVQSSVLYQSYRNLFSAKPIDESLKLSGLWILPNGYGLKMLRFEYPFKGLVRAGPPQDQYQAILQFEGWGQQWLWQIPEHRLSWQGRIQFRSRPLSLVYQAMTHREGWQAFLQGHLRGGHHLGVSYTLPHQNASNKIPTFQSMAGNWTLEWKWVGLQSSRSARALLNAESSRLECRGQFTLSRKNNTAPISATNGSSLIILNFYGDLNANGIRDPDEITLDAAGALDLPAGIPSQILVNGAALLGPFSNYSRVRIRLTPHHMRSPGWVSDHPAMELQSIPNSTVKYQIGLLRGRQILGNLDLSGIPSSTLPPSLITNPGGIRIYACRLDKEHSTEPCLGNNKPTSYEPQSCMQSLTLSDGYFEFNDLMPGLYKVWVDWSFLQRSGYSEHYPPQILDLRQEESMEVNFNATSSPDIP